MTPQARRRDAVDALLAAILDCKDADIVMETVLMARRADSPDCAFADEASAADLWTTSCTPAQLAIYARAAVQEVERRGFGLELRADLAWRLAETLPAAMKARFAKDWTARKAGPARTAPGPREGAPQGDRPEGQSDASRAGG